MKRKRKLPKVPPSTGIEPLDTYMRDMQLALLLLLDTGRDVMENTDLIAKEGYPKRQEMILDMEAFLNVRDDLIGLNRVAGNVAWGK